MEILLTHASCKALLAWQHKRKWGEKTLPSLNTALLCARQENWANLKRPKTNIKLCQTEIERKEECSPLKQSVGLIWERKIWENMQKLKINIESPSESTGNSRPVLMGEWWLQQAYIWQNRTNPLTEERISQPCKCFIFRFDEYMPNREHDTASLLAGAVLLFSILMIKVFNEILTPLSGSFESDS